MERDKTFKRWVVQGRSVKSKTWIKLFSCSTKQEAHRQIGVYVREPMYYKNFSSFRVRRLK